MFIQANRWAFRRLINKEEMKRKGLTNSLAISQALSHAFAAIAVEEPGFPPTSSSSLHEFGIARGQVSACILGSLLPAVSPTALRSVI